LGRSFGETVSPARTYESVFVSGTPQALMCRAHLKTLYLRASTPTGRRLRTEPAMLILNAPFAARLIHCEAPRPPRRCRRSLLNDPTYVEPSVPRPAHPARGRKPTKSAHPAWLSHRRFAANHARRTQHSVNGFAVCNTFQLGPLRRRKPPHPLRSEAARFFAPGSPAYSTPCQHVC